MRPGPRTPRAERTAACAALCLAAVAACAPDEPESAWPSRNYSGTYAVHARVSENACQAPVFAFGDTLLLEVAQAFDNQAVVRIAPVIVARGAFRGDRLEARSAVALPAAAAAAAEPADSLRYDLTLDFADDAVAGSYAVQQPALADMDACRQAFELKGKLVPAAGAAPNGR